jgi:hypothetical protein
MKSHSSYCLASLLWTDGEGGETDSPPPSSKGEGESLGSEDTDEESFIEGTDEGGGTDTESESIAQMPDSPKSHVSDTPPHALRCPQPPDPMPGG